MTTLSSSPVFPLDFHINLENKQNNSNFKGMVQANQLPCFSLAVSSNKSNYLD